jgi:transposase
VRVPWAEARSRFTLLFESFAINVLRETDVLGAARILGITWDEAHGIMERAVERGLARREHRVPEYVGIDEKAIAKG